MVKAFLLGIYEFRCSFTTAFENEDYLISYDRGRELAHKLTFRYWDK